MPKVVDLKGDHWTYGAEHEFSDWDTRKGLPEGYARSPDYTIVNSNGIAAQPNPKVYHIGGEINTPPTHNVSMQANCLGNILDIHPECTVNYRSNLHIHIRVPGLKDSLKHLMRVQRYIHEELPKYINIIEPIPIGTTTAEKKREKRRRVSHHTFLTKHRLEHQLQASTVKEFFEREVPATRSGKPMWHAQPRLAVGLRQILQTDTVEFRHFPGTIDPEELLVCLQWCHLFMMRVLNEEAISKSEAVKWSRKMPQFPQFDEKLEIGYQATASHNGLSQSQIKHNINLILAGKFNAHCKEYQEARERTCCMSRKHLP